MEDAKKKSMVLRARNGQSLPSSSSRDIEPNRRSERNGGRRRSGFCLTALILSTFLLLLIWVVSNWMSGVQGLLSMAWAWPGVEGVPTQCGSDGRSTWMWMNPAGFNDSFSGLLETKKKRPGPFFLVGCGHSGTTPLLALLATHPQMWAYTPNEALEYSVKPNSFRDVGRISSMLPPLVFSKEDDKSFRQMSKKRKPAVKRWLVKSPSNVCRLGYIFATLGRDAKTVALVRDGRDVMISLLERYPNEDPGGALVLGRWANDNAALLLYENDPRLEIVKYEDLFLEPPHYPTLRKILRHAHLDVSPIDQMLLEYGKAESKRRRGHRLSATTASKEHTRLRRNQTSQPFRRAPPRWPVQMTPELASVFVQNQKANDLLDYYGYLDVSPEVWSRLLSVQPKERPTLSFFSRYIRGKKQVQFAPLPMTTSS